MSSKFKAALFVAKVYLNNSDGTQSIQDAMTVVAETSVTKQFAAATFAIERTAADTFANMRILSATNMLVGQAKDAEFNEILKNICLCTNIVSQNSGSNAIDKIELLEKFDLFFFDNEFKSKAFNRPYGLNDKDTNGQKLLDFLTFNFDFAQDSLKDFTLSKQNVSRKFAVAKKQRDFNLFWNSPFISKTEKEYCKTKIDLDICMSNSNKDMFKVLKRTLFAEYPERNWVFNILFGDPSSGKTTMVENLCALYNIPFVKLTGDPTISMTKLIMTVGPENVQTSLNKQDYIDKCKAKGLSDSEIQTLSDKINELIVSNKDVDVQLTEQESIILKCLKHGLPLLVLLDEVNMFTTLLMATLADVITSGYVNVGVHTYKDDGHNIMWFGAYNPNTYKCSPFEGKFRDRALFFCSEMPTQEQMIEHKQRKVVASLFGTSSVLSSIQEQLETLCQDYPDKSEELNLAFNLVSNICLSTTPSSEAVQWFFDYKVNEILCKSVPTFKEKEFSDYYINDCKLDSIDNVEEAVKRIIVLKDKVNELLKTLTRGIDSKNPDSNFYFYIPNRAVDYFIDLIFCFSSVQRAVDFMVYNLIPNGDTVRYNSSSNPADDISKSICNTLSNDIADLQQFLFTNVNDAEIKRQLISVVSTEYDPNCWTPDFEDVDLNTVKVESSSSSSDSILDEAEDLL